MMPLEAQNCFKKTIIKFFAPITLKLFNGQRKLSFNIGHKSRKMMKHFRFKSHGKNPREMSKIISKKNIITVHEIEAT